MVILTSGCSKAASNAVATISFPASDYGKNEFNSSVYEIKPFSISMELPEKWSVEEDKSDKNYELLSVFTKYSILNEDKVCVGAVGYNIYENYPGSEDDPRAIYNQICLGNDYHFDVRDGYNVVNKTDYGTTALADVYYAGSINNGEEKHNKGILSYNKNLMAYVAFEFDSKSITDEEITKIAKSISFS